VELQRCYELLGVKPGVSPAELKAAHRDMAKVWHPDRFGHDPRLQQKAQEKLKEINEAFDILISGKVPRPAAEPRYEHQWETGNSARKPTNPTAPAVRRSEHRSSFRWQRAVLPVLLFAVVFGFTFRSLLNRSSKAVESDVPGSVASSEQQRQQPGSTKAEASREKRETESREQITETAPSTETRPLPTTTVTIDPTSGLLARSDCPSKTHMTYPSGNEPSASCTLNHQQQAGPEVTQETAKTSRVKSLTKKIVTRLNNDTKSDGWSRQ